MARFMTVRITMVMDNHCTISIKKAQVLNP